MTTSTTSHRALVRAPSAAYERALVQGVPDPVDLPLLSAQHRAIVATLEAWGLALRVLEPLPNAADACFVEDRAVVIGSAALITNSAEPSRAVESASVAEALGAELEISRMSAGTLDGGDVLQVGSLVVVGRSARTDAAGVSQLRDFARRHGRQVLEVDVQGLHLKCVCSALDRDTVLIAEGFGLEYAMPAGTRVLSVPAEEAYAANAVGFKGHALVAAGYPITAARVAAAGFEVTELDNSEFAKRDGSLTCLSVLF